MNRYILFLTILFIVSVSVSAFGQQTYSISNLASGSSCVSGSCVDDSSDDGDFVDGDGSGDGNGSDSVDGDGGGDSSPDYAAILSDLSEIVSLFSGVLCGTAFVFGLRIRL